jgi:hypothetical protein
MYSFPLVDTPHYTGLIPTRQAVLCREIHNRTDAANVNFQPVFVDLMNGNVNQLTNQVNMFCAKTVFFKRGVFFESSPFGRAASCDLAGTLCSPNKKTHRGHPQR